MPYNDLRTTIESAYEQRSQITPRNTSPDVGNAVETVLELLDAGTLRVAEKLASGWHTNEWLKKAVLLSFRLNDMAPSAGGPGGSTWWDKVPSKFDLLVLQVPTSLRISRIVGGDFTPWWAWISRDHGQCAA